jgi:hypothetical protein
MYIQNAHHFPGFKLTFADWFKFSLIEELTYEIYVRFEEKMLTNDALDSICFLAVTLPYYSLLISSLLLT